MTTKNRINCIIMLLVLSCSNSTQEKYNNIIFVDPFISSKIKKMFSTNKQSSYPKYAITYSNGSKTNTQIFKNEFQCSAFFKGRDTILIKNTTDSDMIGIRIYMVNGKYELRNNFDNIHYNKNERNYDFAYNHLILNKNKFKVGDSIYGSLKFNFTTTNKLGKNKINDKGEIFFRTKVFANVIDAYK